MPDWLTDSLDFLISTQRADGGWSYFSHGDSAIEPTAAALAALMAHGRGAALFDRGRQFIASLQDSSGAIIPQPSQTGQPTTLAAFAAAVIAFWRAEDPLPPAVADYLLGYEPITAPRTSVIADDSSLRGFAWREHTYSWVEPTAYGLFLLDRLGRSPPRADEARRVLRDRHVPGGGWNYGNSVVFGQPLESAVMPTALALLALHDDGGSEPVLSGIQYLLKQATATPSPLSLAWLIVALRARAIDAPSPDRLGELLAASKRAAGSPWHRAAAALAAAPLDKNPFVFGAAP